MEEFDERSYNLTLSKVGTVSLRIQVLGFFSLFVRVLFFCYLRLKSLTFTLTISVVFSDFSDTVYKCM